MSSDQPSPSPPTFTTTPKSAPDPRSPWHRRHHRAVFVGSIVLAFLIGIGAGAAGPQEELTRAQAELADERRATDAAEEQASRAEEQARTAEARASASAREDLADERARLRADATALNRRKAELDRRESKVTGLEAEAKRNSFDGTGTYLVGSDIKPGTYRAAATPGCYWARLSSLDTSDINDNNNADGPVVVEILATDKAFEARNCGTFTRMGG